MGIIIGSHVSFKKDNQLLGCVKETLSYEANTFMFYTGTPQNTKREPLNDELTKMGQELMKENNIDINNVIVHAPYIVNLANKTNYDFNVSFLKQEIDRCEKLGITKIVLHPGSHVGLGVDIGIQNIVDTLNEVIEENMSVFICLETMAGKGSECGSNFEEIKKIIDGVKYNNKLLVCFDTCHLNDAGYDITNFDNILDEFDRIIGLDKLGCIHVNDSKNERGMRKDRHSNFGLGNIGFDNLIKVIYNPRVLNIPKILETPYITDPNDDKKSYPPYKWEIKMIREKTFDEDLVNHVISS